MKNNNDIQDKKINQRNHDLTNHEIEELIDQANNGNVEVILPFIPCLLQHSSWIIRCDILEIIGRFGLKKYRKFVSNLLKQDPNKHVKSYALLSLNDLSNTKNISFHKPFLVDKDISLRLTALMIDYLQSKKMNTIEIIKKIAIRKNCNYHHQYAIFHFFKDNLNIENDSLVKELFENIVASTGSSTGVHKDIKSFLKS